MGHLVTHRQSLLLIDVTTIGSWPPGRHTYGVFEESVVRQPDVADTEAYTGLARERSFAVQPTKTKPESRCSSMQKQATRLRLSEAGFPLTDLNALFITHHHSDHMMGLTDLLNSYWMMGLRTGSPQLPLFAPYDSLSLVMGPPVGPA